MKQNCCLSQAWIKIVLLFMTVVLSVVPVVAATDLQIMVSGPWAYVTNDKTRIFLVAPQSMHHLAYIFAGTNAADFRNQTTSQIGSGVYKLDYDPTLKGAYNGKPQKDATLIPFSVSDPTYINTVLSSSGNFVISLPMPDDWTTYVDPSGAVDGHSESKVASVSVTSKVPKKGTQYTTWLVLHYSMTTLPPSLQQTGTATANVPTTDQQGKSPGGISIVLGDPDLLDNDRTCDGISLASFIAQNNLWHQTQYARFPMLDKNGKQKHGKYDYDDCSDSVPDMKAMERVKKENAESVQPNLFSGGGADCHGGQINVNNALK
jgi:hypothetical protein